MVWIILAVLALVLISFIYALYHYTFYNDPSKPMKSVLAGDEYDKRKDILDALSKEAHSLPYEEVHVKSFDGLDLCGYLYVTDPSKPFQIGFHGYKANGLTNFCGGMKAAYDCGYNILLTDHRASGKSKGHTVTFGIKERKDVPVWAKYIADRFGADAKILLYGVSMGGATVLMSADQNLPSNVKGIFADCPYSSAYDIIKSVIAGSVKPAGLVMPFMEAAASFFGGFDLNETSSVSAVSNSSLPVYIIHGSADTFVPVSMSREVYEKNPGHVTFTEIDGAPHAISYAVDSEKYMKTYRDFTENVLKI